MHTIVLLTSLPVALVAALHWHWVKDQIIHTLATEGIRWMWHKLSAPWDAVLSILVSPFLVPLPDPAPVLNGAMILGGFASVMCALMAPARARGILAVGGMTAIAVGLSREVVRKNSNAEVGLASQRF